MHFDTTNRSSLLPVLSQREVAPRHFRLRLQAPQIALRCLPGQFVHVLPGSLTSLDPLLRRAFSIASVQSDSIELVYRVEGRSTAAMSRLREGDTLDVLGPLGRPWGPLPLRSWLVGGGVGVPPLAMLATTRQDPGLSVLALLGARTKQELICLEDFEGCGVPVEIATDDGSRGHHGRVTDLLRRNLQNDAADGQCADSGIFACGPWPMLRAVASLAREFGVACQVSLEESMPCGIGVCNGCVVPTRAFGDDYGRYRRICIDGPVVDALTVDWGDPEPEATL